MRAVFSLFVVLSVTTSFGQETYHAKFHLYQASAAYGVVTLPSNYSKKSPIGHAEIIRVRRTDGTIEVRETIQAKVRVQANGPFGVPMHREVKTTRTCVESPEGLTLAFEEDTVIGEAEIHAEYNPQQRTIHVETKHALMPTLKKDVDIPAGALAPTRQTFDLLSGPPSGPVERDYAFMCRGGHTMSKPTTVSVNTAAMSRTFKPRNFYGKTQNWTVVSEKLLMGDGDSAFFDTSGRLTRWTIRLYDLRPVEAFPVSVN